ncbi:ABC transporter ATP-binding protein [Reinekea thalattae]|uniref:ABC transporter ATP-binding protein n=1 Tax=Reinekea thalattae TaxID=2593301 RepID=A0A5C8ZBW6_9GAMM|nr:ABC transporter ATP-binding protein [Reinekea thalattae]TXR54779.1 ABC transporter ATP-binding protein [Reinekea thalattae]
MTAQTQVAAKPAIELCGIDKRFGAVHANKNIDLKVAKGTIHGIVGENGAGKSTLMSIIYGFYEADSGEILIDNKVTKIADSKTAIASGIGMVHQHFMLIQNFTALENVILGAESGVMLNVSLDKARKELTRLASEYGLDVPLDVPVEQLSVGMQQRIEILKALYRGAKVLILDEPTGVLTPQEAEHLFKVLEALKKQGSTVIIITHKLQEIMAITDNVSIMRRGEMVGHVKTAETNREQLAEMMVGRKVLLNVNKTAAKPTDTLLKVNHLSWQDDAGVQRLEDVAFSVRAGEIVGIAGVSGNGQSELLELLSGIKDIQQGSVEVAGTQLDQDSQMTPEQLRAIGVAHIPEDRHKMGLVNSFAADEAFILGYHRADQYNGKLLMDQAAIRKDCAEKMQKWDVRPQDPKLKAANFSGGNQQKLVIAREMEQKPDVLLVGQPTRGVDIGAIESIHNRIIEMRDAGKAVLLVSVELEEIMSLADRILVMFDGKIVGEVPASKANEQILGLMMANIVPDEVKALQQEAEA